MFRLRRRTAPLAAIAAVLFTLTVGPLVAQPAFASDACNATTRLWKADLLFAIPSYRSTINCHMTTGGGGAAVNHLQQTLNLCYGKTSTAPGRKAVIDRITVDGVFGSQTKNALAAVQRAERISADGVYGPQTRRSILWYAWHETGQRHLCFKYGA